MYSAYQDREELEDNLYQEDGDSDVSEANSELEFHLYSQLHYFSNAGELDEPEPGAEENINRQESQEGGALEKTTDKDTKLRCTKQSNPTSSTDGHLKTKKDAKKKKSKIEPKIPKLLSSRFEEVIVIDSSPGVISISDDDSDDEDDASVCALKALKVKGSQTLQTSTPALQVEEIVRYSTTCIRTLHLRLEGHISSFFEVFLFNFVQVSSSSEMCLKKDKKGNAAKRQLTCR